MLNNCEFRDDFQIPNEFSNPSVIQNHHTINNLDETIQNTNHSNSTFMTQSSFVQIHDSSQTDSIVQNSVGNLTTTNATKTTNNSNTSLFDSMSYTTFQSKDLNSSNNSNNTNNPFNIVNIVNNDFFNDTETILTKDDSNLKVNSSTSLNETIISNNLDCSIINSTNLVDEHQIDSNKSELIQNLTMGLDDKNVNKSCENNIEQTNLIQTESGLVKNVSTTTDQANLMKRFKKIKPNTKRKSNFSEFLISDCNNNNNNNISNNNNNTEISNNNDKMNFLNKKQRSSLENTEIEQNEEKIENKELNDSIENNSMQRADDLEVSREEIDFTYLSKKHRQLQNQNYKPNSIKHDVLYNSEDNFQLNSYVSNSINELSQLDTSKIDFTVNNQNSTNISNRFNTNQEPEQFKTKKSKALPEKATRIMKEWYEANRHNPYPTDDERRIMAEQGEINENQVKAWFANKRNRSSNTKNKLKQSKQLNDSEQIKTNYNRIDNLALIKKQNDFNMSNQLCMNEQDLNMNKTNLIKKNLDLNMSKSMPIQSMIMNPALQLQLNNSIDNINQKNLKSKSKTKEVEIDHNFKIPPINTKTNQYRSYYNDHNDILKAAVAVAANGLNNQQFLPNSFQSKPNNSYQTFNPDIGIIDNDANYNQNRFMYQQPQPQQPNNFNNYYIYNQQSQNQTQSKYQLDLNNNYSPINFNQNQKQNLIQPNLIQNPPQTSYIPYLNQSINYNDCFNSNRYFNNVFMNSGNGTNTDNSNQIQIDQNGLVYSNHRHHPHHHHHHHHHFSHQNQYYDNSFYNNLIPHNNPISCNHTSSITNYDPNNLIECTICINCTNDCHNQTSNSSITPNMSLNLTPINPNTNNQQFRCDTPPPIITKKNSSTNYTQSITNSNNNNNTNTNQVENIKLEEADKISLSSLNKSQPNLTYIKTNKTTESTKSINLNNNTSNPSTTNQQHQQNETSSLNQTIYPQPIKPTIDSINFFNYSFTTNNTNPTLPDYNSIQPNTIVHNFTMSNKSPISNEPINNNNNDLVPLTASNTFNNSFYTINDYIANAPTVNINNINYTNPNANLLNSLSNIFKGPVITTTASTNSNSMPSSSASSINSSTSPSDITILNLNDSFNNINGLNYKDVVTKNNQKNSPQPNKIFSNNNCNKTVKNSNNQISNIVKTLNSNEQDYRFTDSKAKEWCMKSHPKLSNTLLSTVSNIQNNLVTNQTNSFASDLLQTKKYN